MTNSEKPQLSPVGSIRTPTAATAAAALSVRNLEFFYGTHRALKNITLDIGTKRVTAIIGPSGCGKSTLLRVFNRIYDIYPKLHARGEVILDNENILDPNYSLNRLRSRVGMVFQKPVPFPMSIQDNIAFGIRHHERLSRSQMQERIEQSLRDAALWEEVKDVLGKSALSLSGGQQQRLCIARAIALRPQVLLLDEPTSALDPISTAKVEELIQNLRNNFTVVIVTHNMQQAVRVSDYTAFMYLGELVEYGPTRSIFTAPTKPQTEAYVSGRFG